VDWGIKFSIGFLIFGRAALTISRNAGTAGFPEDLRQAMHRGIRADFGMMERITTGRFRLATQRGTIETQSPLSTRVSTVAIKSGSFTMRGEKPARRQTEMTSSNKLREPLRWNWTTGSPARLFKRTIFCLANRRMGLSALPSSSM